MQHFSLFAGWAHIDVSPTAFMSLVYHNFRISIYRKDSSSNNCNPSADPQFYYSPALILDPAKTTVLQNPFTQRFETTLEVVMWDATFEKAVQDALSAKLGQPVPLSNIRVLPIENIRAEFTRQLSEAHEKYTFDNRWASYANQPARFRFHLTCLDRVTCTALAKNIEDHPKLFTRDLIVYYSLESRINVEKQVALNEEHFTSSPSYAPLMQSRRLPTSNEQPHSNDKDLRKRLTMEIVRNVLTDTVGDPDVFVSRDEVDLVAEVVSTTLEAALNSNASNSLSGSFHGWTDQKRTAFTHVSVTSAVFDLSSRINVLDGTNAVMPSERICFGNDCVEAEDFRRLRQLTVDGHNGQVCLTGVCLKNDDFRRLIDLPNRLQTDSITGAFGLLSVSVHA